MTKKDKPAEIVVLRRDFSANVLDVYGRPCRVQMDQVTILKAIERFVREAPGDAADLFNKILEEEGQRELTLAIAAAEALGGAYEGEQGMGFEERDRRYELAKRVCKGGVLEITTNERDKIKSLLPKRFLGSVIAPSAGRLLELDAPPEEVEPEALPAPAPAPVLPAPEASGS